MAPRSIVVALVTLVPLAILAGGYFLLVAAGVPAARALSPAGLVSVAVAGAWGLFVGASGIDAKLFGRRPPEE